MATFDFIDFSARAYTFTWDKRDILVRLALWPVIIKLTTYTAIVALGLEENVLRQGILLLPSYFAEGWLVAVAIRMALFDERWDGGAPDGQQAEQRQKIILGSTIIYVLTKMALAVLMGLAALSEEQAQAEGAPQLEPTADIYLVVMIFIAVVVWAFRFVWLYVPAALDYDVGDFLKRIKGYVSSLYILGLWMMCFIPIALMLLMASEALSNVFPADGDTYPAAFKYSMASIQSVMEVLSAVVSGIAMGYATQAVMKGDNEKVDLF